MLPNRYSRHSGPHSHAELEEDLLEDQDRTGAAQDGERLTREHGVGHPR